MNTNKRKTLLATFVALFASGATVQANAQNEFGDQATSQSVLEEIIVTANKREQNIQDVPASISALSASMLENRGITTPQDLQYSVPGLTIGETSVGSAQVTIRGVGTENASAGGDPGVPLHIDGHYIQFPAYMLKDLLDVERVEVQRGPQGTLYGRNAVGGNINIITKRPSDAFEGSLSLALGNYNKRQLQAVVSGPMTDSLRGRVAMSKDKRDGIVENISPLANNDELLGSDYTSVRASLEYDATDNIEVYLSGYHYEDDSITTINRIRGPYPTTGIYTGLNLPYTNISASDPGKVRSEFDNKGRDDAEGVSLDISWDLGSVTFKSLTAYNDATKFVNQDIDSTDLALRNQASEFNSDTYTQEFQLLSDDSADLKWILGLFYFKEASDFEFIINIPNTPTIFETPGSVDTTSLAAFGQIDYSLSDDLELTVGLRHSKDEKDMDRSIFLTFDGINVVLDDQSTIDDSWNQTSGKLGLTYHVTEDVMVYGSYSLGFKAGGFNATSVTQPSYKPELLDAYEVGMKGAFLDNRLQLNIATFYYDYTDKTEVVVALQPGAAVATAIFTNAGAATISGIDFEVQARVTEGLSVDASLAYQNAEYDKFDNASDPSNSALGLQDLSGNKLSRSPDLKFHLGLQYEVVLDNNLGQITARLDYSWIDEQYYRPFNLDTDKQDSYHRTNAKLQWNSSDDNWLAEFYVRNLEDDYIFSNLTVAGPGLGFGQYASYFEPRTYGLKLNYSF